MISMGERCGEKYVKSLNTKQDNAEQDNIVVNDNIITSSKQYFIEYIRHDTIPLINTIIKDEEKLKIFLMVLMPLQILLMRME